MKLSAYVRDRETKKHTIIERDYQTKKLFSRELRANGYTVIRISNKRDILAQHRGFESFRQLKNFSKDWEKNPELWSAELKFIKSIEAIEL